MTPGRYLRLRRRAARLGIDDTPLAGLSVLAIEVGGRAPTDIELWALRCAFAFDVGVLVAIARGIVPQLCRTCGCSESDACVEQISARAAATCAWAEHDLCTACVERSEPLPEGLAA